MCIFSSDHYATHTIVTTRGPERALPRRTPTARRRKRVKKKAARRKPKPTPPKNKENKLIPSSAHAPGDDPILCVPSLEEWEGLEALIRHQSSLHSPLGLNPMEPCTTTPSSVPRPGVLYSE